MAWYQGKYDQMVHEAQAIFDLSLHYRHPWFIGELAYWQWRGDRLDEVPKTMAEPYAAQIAGDVRRAARLWEERGCQYEQAVALSDSPVEDDLLNALQIVLDLDAKPAIAMVRQKLRQIGSTKILRGPRGSTRANPAGLTNRQLQILKLIADGLTNDEIARRLFISPKTVEHHVSTILSKLNVQSRQEAANFAHEHDLLDQK
jgi:DNA-binding CsgD family transcriptional regulator